MTDQQHAALMPETLTETFDCIRGDLHLYEIGEIDYSTLMAGLRESIEILAAKEVKT